MLVPYVWLRVVDVQFSPVFAAGQEVIDREVFVDEDTVILRGAAQHHLAHQGSGAVSQDSAGPDDGLLKARSHSRKRCCARSSSVKPLSLPANS